MNNPNPFVPKGSILELQSQRRSRLKLAVFCVLAVGVTGLAAMLIQGCKREMPVDADAPTIDTNAPAITETNPPAIDTNMPAYVPPVMTNPPVVVTPPVVESAGTEYVVLKGDSLAKIAKKNGVTLKALELANPGVVPTKLKVGQKLTIPAGGSISAAPAAAAVESTGASVGGEVYLVKSGDTLTKIAKHLGVSVKALEGANGLSTTKIKVGQKLKVPGKAEPVAPPVAAPAPVMPVVPEPIAPVTTPSPAPVK